MKKMLLPFAFLLLPLVFITGCQEFSSVKQKPVEVTIEGGGEFPDFLAGVWDSNETGWQITFEPNGVISSIVHSMGRTELKPGETKQVPMRMGGKSIYEPGKWIVNYDPATSILTVEIELKHLYLEIGTGTVRGSCSDIFVGPVSKDEQVWNVHWSTFLKATAHTPKKPSADLSTDPVYGESQDIIFKKERKQ